MFAVREQLARLKTLGVEIGLLSNMTRQTLDANLRANNLADTFDFVLSTDIIRSYKPDPSAYALATRELNVPREAVKAGAAVKLGCDHTNYPAHVTIGAETLASLAGDLK